MSDAALNEYWLANYVNEEVRLCSLCGNTGIIDTRGRAVSPAGVVAGRLNYCICPNGQEQKRTDRREGRTLDQ